MNPPSDSCIRRQCVWFLALSAFVLPCPAQRTLTLRFPSDPDRIYEIWQSGDARAWSPFDLAVAGTGGPVMRVLENADQGMRFFWLRPRPEPYELLQGRVNADVDLHDLRGTFTASTWRETVLRALTRRFPDAAGIVRRHRSPGGFDFWFGGRTSDWGEVVEMLSSAVHESVHIVGFEAFSMAEYKFPMSGEATLVLRRIPTFHRSEILGDLPPGLADLGYSGTYLTGQSGAQGFETLLDELSAYTFSLLVDLAFADQFPAGSRRSSRDGLLALMLFTETYLKAARDWYPEVHSRITETPGWPEAVVTLWDRAIQALALSGSDVRLELGAAAQLRPHVFDPELLGEIERVRRFAMPALGIRRD